VRRGERDEGGELARLTRSPARALTRAHDTRKLESQMLRRSLNKTPGLIYFRHGGGKGLRCSTLGYLVVLFPTSSPFSDLSAVISCTTPLLQTAHCVPPQADPQKEVSRGALVPSPVHGNSIPLWALCVSLALSNKPTPPNTQQAGLATRAICAVRTSMHQKHHLTSKDPPPLPPFELPCLSRVVLCAFRTTWRKAERSVIRAQ